MFDWNDLKYLLAVAQHGSTLAASRALAVDQSTVQRRVAELERRIGLLLIKRDRTGYHLTDAGKGLLAWRGMGVKEIDTQANPEKREKSINNAVKKILKNYPPKQKT